MDNFEKHIGSQLQNDKLHFSADPAIKDRLIYHMQLKSSKSAVHKNQILPFLGELFAPKLLVWKLGIVTVLLISSMSYNYYHRDASIIQVADSTRIIGSIDTTNIQFKDTLSIN
jgi:hypothetical protein